MGVGNSRSSIFKRMFSRETFHHFHNTVVRGLALKKSSPERLSLRLEFNHKVLYEVSDLSASDTITIGRSADCTWVMHLRLKARKL